MTEADAPPVEGRVARNRRRRTEAFLAAGLRIATDDGLEALTMARLAEELDTAVGSVYRYFSSKAELLGAIESHAIQRLHDSHDRSVPAVAEAVMPLVEDSEALVRLVVLGRWFCAASERYPEEVRLLQLVSSRRSTSVTPEAAAGILPAAMVLVANISATIEGAVRSGDLRAGEPLGRAIMWLTAFGGVVVADDLEKYVPDVLGGGRLARQLNADLFVGWGAAPEALARIDAAIDGLGGQPPIAQ
jgi:AcrR family transcriptional regulator